MEKWKNKLNNIISIIKNRKKSKPVAAAFAVFFLASAAVICLRTYERSRVIRLSEERLTFEENFKPTGDRIFELNERLWLVNALYFRNLNSDGKFQGNEYYKKSVSDALKKLGMMDEHGNIKKEAFEIPGYNYSIVKNGKNIFSSEDDVQGKPDNERFYIEFNDGGYGINIPGSDYLDGYLSPIIPDYEYFNYPHDRKCYSNRKGMEYYYFNTEKEYDGYWYEGKGIAVYNYDTSDLISYTDELGAEIYLSENGMDPVPYEYGGDADSYCIIDSGPEVSIYVYPSEEDEIIYRDYIDKLYYNPDEYFRDAYYMVAPEAVIIVFLLPSALFVLAARGYDRERRRFYCDKRIIPNELCIAAMVMLLVPQSYLFYNYSYPVNPIRCLQNAAVSAAFLTGLLFFLSELILRIKCRRFSESFLIGSVPVVSGLTDRYRRRTDVIAKDILIKSVLLLGAAAICLFESLCDYYAELSFVAAVLIVLFFVSILNDLKAIKELGKHIDELSSGVYSKKTVRKSRPDYYLTDKLNWISVNINEAVESQLRSERMKVDLVTNVSHDIKTPLTSIVSYVDLLSKDETLSPESRSYVQILEQKTDRLKKIVSDLFDLAKATSGTDVDSEEIDAVILINQVLADMDDKIHRYGKTVKTEIYTDEAHIMADGKKMYRTIQNIIDNALKYSLDGTRIFLSVSEENSDVLIKLKNTSSYEMNFSTDEITERFVRGDCSRTSEGSGLGLSIAKSFTEACGGTFNVQIDGDTFSVNISFPMVEKADMPDDLKNIVPVSTEIYDI